MSLKAENAKCQKSAYGIGAIMTIPNRMLKRFTELETCNLTYVIQSHGQRAMMSLKAENAKCQKSAYGIGAIMTI